MHSSMTRERSRNRSLPRLPIPPAMKPISNEELEDHLTSYNTVSSSLGKSPYELAAAIPKSAPKSTVNERAKSLTAQFEADAAARFNLARASSQMGQQAPQQMTRVRSYDSIANGNPFASGNNSRRSSREHHPPPQVQRNNAPWRPSPAPNPAAYSTQSLPLQLPTSQSPLTAHPPQFHRGFPKVERGEEKSFSGVSAVSKPKSQPPVSMNTQRNSKLIQTAQQLVPPPSHAPPAPPAQKQTQNQGDGAEKGWNNTASAWATRRQSAGEALQSRKSMEMRPAQELRGRKSMDAARFNRPASEQRELKGRGSYDQMRWEQGAQQVEQGMGDVTGLGIGKMQSKRWNVGVGYEDAHAYPSPPRQTTQSWTVGAKSQQEQEYDHTYGSSLHHSHSYEDKENFYQAQEYYEAEQQEDAQLGEMIHQRKTSTSEMLVLDRFSGGLDYGYEPGLGLVGSAGMRNVRKMANANRKSVVAAERWGVDLTDVPVFLQRVRVEG